MSTGHRATLSKRRKPAADVQRNFAGLADSVSTVVQEKLHEACEAVTEFCDEHHANVRGFERSIEKCIADRPFSALITAAAAGFLVRMLWRR